MPSSPARTATTIVLPGPPPGATRLPRFIVTCKPSVRLKEITPALARIFFVLEHLARRSCPPELRPTEWVITSINDGTHMAGSRHYTNEAIDLRSRSFPSERAKRAFRAHLEHVLNLRYVGSIDVAGLTEDRLETWEPKKFRVLYEGVGTPNEHFHVQVAKGQVYTGEE